MKRRSRHLVRWLLPLGLYTMGCATLSAPVEIQRSLLPNTGTDKKPVDLPVKSTATLDNLTPPEDKVITVEAKDVARTRPVYAQLETLPIDMPTVIRMVNENSPAIAIAQAKVREAEARLEIAGLQWIPNLSLGGVYNRSDGQTQNSNGVVFGVSKSSLFGLAAPVLAVDTGDAYYRPLIERRLASAEQWNERAVNLNAELDAVGAYLDLLQVYAQIEINIETLKNAEGLLVAAKNAKETKLDRTAGDVHRAQTEVLFRRVERMELEGKAGIASARLGKLLVMQPNVKLVPGVRVIAPVTLIDPKTTLDDLLAQATTNRPDLAANREAIEAAWMRVRRAETAPFWPKLVLSNQVGGFGGGVNSDMSNFSSRNDVSVQLYWEIRNLGWGNRAATSERRALLDQVQSQFVENQARAAAEIVEAAQLAASRYEALDLAEQAVKEALELYRINMESMTNVIDAKNLVDALRPLQALQALSQARLSYLAAVMDFNRAQYRLFTAVGNPPSSHAP